MRSNNSLHIFANYIQKQSLKYFIIETWIVFTSSLTIWRKCNFQELGLHSSFIDHNINPINCPAFIIVHFRILHTCSNKGVSKHFLYFVIDNRPIIGSIVLLKILNEIFVRNLLEISNIAIVHNCKLCLVSR